MKSKLEMSSFAAKPSNPIIIYLFKLLFLFHPNYNINGKFGTNRTVYNRRYGVLSN